jgi:uncharacterized membrane protein YphA (DoxX/SURF4 family)
MSIPAIVSRTRAVRLLVWAATIVVGLGVGLAGAAKLVTQVWQPLFADWGYPPWFVAVVGALEVVGGVCLFVPRLAFYAALSLGGIMIAAFVTLRLHPGGALGSGATPLFYTLVLSAIAGARWRDRYPLRGSAAS